MQRSSQSIAVVLATIALSVALFAPANASAQDSGFGLGFILGDPNGLSFKAYVGPSAAIDGAVGFGVIDDSHVAAHLDFLWEWQLASMDWSNLAFTIGVGPKIGHFYHHDSFRVGVRAPFGLALQFNEAPLDCFLEVAPGLWIIDNARFDIDAGLGLRYWF